MELSNSDAAVRCCVCDGAGTVFAMVEISQALYIHKKCLEPRDATLVEIDLDKDILVWLAEQSVRTNLSVNQLVNIICRAYFQEQTERRTRHRIKITVRSEPDGV